MAATVTLPVIGKVPTTYVWVAGAGAAGVLGYAWWTRGLAEAEDTGVDETAYDAYGYPLEPGGTPDYRPPTVVDSNVDVDETQGYQNNAEWFDAAVDRLTTNFGVSDVATAAAALGRYLDRQRLSVAQAAMVSYVVNAIGQPPEGRPYQILPELGPPAAVALPAPVGLSGQGTPTHITWSWQPVTGATGYDVELVEGISTVTERATITATSWTPRKTLQLNRPYRINVWARNSAGQRGARATLVSRTTGPQRITTAPAVRVVNATRTDLHFRWNPVPGASGYIVEGVIGSNTRVFSKLQSGTSYIWRGLRPNHQYRLRVAGAQSRSNIGPQGTVVGRTDR